MIVPRWEWRTFGETFGDAEVRLAALPPTRVVETEELYVLSSRFEGSIKVRGGKLDVKRLERRGEDGLEQWKPVANAAFPITAADVAADPAAARCGTRTTGERGVGPEHVVAVTSCNDDLGVLPPDRLATAQCGELLMTSMQQVRMSRFIGAARN
jgi:hypothetical protein